MQFFLVKNHVKSLPKNFAFFEISRKKIIKKNKINKKISIFFFSKRTINLLRKKTPIRHKKPLSGNQTLRNFFEIKTIQEQTKKKHFAFLFSGGYKSKQKKIVFFFVQRERVYQIFDMLFQPMPTPNRFPSIYLEKFTALKKITG